MQSVFQDTNLENNMTQNWMTRRIKQLEEEKLFAEMQASKELDPRRNTTKTERRHLKHSLGGGEQRAEGASQEVDGKSTTNDDVFARAWSGEFGRELCRMTDTCGETTMNTLSNEATSWFEDQVRHSTAGLSWDRQTEQTRMILAEVGAHTGARMYNTMQELAGTKNANKFGGTGNDLTDTTPTRLLAETLEQKRPRHLWLSLRDVDLLHTGSERAQQIVDSTATDRT